MPQIQKEGKDSALWEIVLLSIGEKINLVTTSAKLLIKSWFLYLQL